MPRPTYPAPNEQLADVFLDESVRQLVRAAITAADEFMEGEPDFSVRIGREPTVVFDSWDIHVRVEVSDADGGDGERQEFPIGTTRSTILRWLREFAAAVKSAE